MEHPKISLEQWRALVAVVEAGGYAQAAERLNKSQSTVSYAVQKLQSLLAIDALVVKGRKAELTSAGRLLYRRGKALLAEASRLERAAAQMAQGWEAELGVAAEIIFPTWLLLECLATLSNELPDMRIQLHESVLGGTAELLSSGRVNLAIASSIPGGFIGDPLMSVRFVAAASPCHPLHQLGRPLTADDLRHHRHLIVRDSGTQPAGDEAFRVTDQRWTVSAKATSIRAACMGLGFAWYAENIIRSELDTGALEPLPLIEGAERWAMLYLVYADSDAAGPGARRLASLLKQACSARENPPDPLYTEASQKPHSTAHSSIP